MAERVERKVAVILCADVVGYSRLMGLDEEGTLAALKTFRREVIDDKIAASRGRIVKTAGDGLLVEFASVVNAVECALDVQDELARRNADIAPERQIRFRMGIHVGDVIIDGDGIYGDGVTLASRLEGQAAPGGVCISRAVRDQVRDRLEVRFEDKGDHALKDMPRPVRIFAIHRADGAPEAETPRLPRGERASMAVLPFQNLSGDSEQEFFLDSLVEDLITELSRPRWFSILARNSSFSYKGKAIDAKQIAREQGVRYIVVGNLRKAGSRVRIAAELIEAESGRQLWAERFDGTLEDSFDLQDRIAEGVGAAVEATLRITEIERARRTIAVHPDIYGLVLVALADAIAMRRAENEAALVQLERILAVEEKHALAKALAAWCRVWRYVEMWGDSGAEELAAVRRLGNAALRSAEDDPLTLAFAGAALVQGSADRAIGMAALDRAVALNGNSPLILALDSFARCVAGDIAGSVRAAEKALRLGPFDPIAYYPATALAMSSLLADRPDDAAAHAGQASQLHADSPWPRLIPIAVAAGQDDGAVADLRRVRPDFRLESLRRFGFVDAARIDAVIDRLRAAGLQG
jgi:adenylate cyclase